jgi:cysteinyl-tRNA synthetase
MELALYDTLTRRKRPFQPIDPARVRMYVCGPTVYDFAHIGNARPVIVFDVLFRLLRHIYGAKHVKYVRNITDVDDKINARAAEEYPDLPLNEAIRKVTEVTEKQFHDDVDALGCLRPSVEPRATKHIKEMKALIDRLIKTKRAYVLDDHVLFRVKGLPSYGKLSHRSLKEMRGSERGEVAPKRDPMDFVLWKPSKPGEPAWSSPGGIKKRGRPGWHIECSAMSWKYLGERFDIHGGGVDLLFPHHENERAQSCRAFNRHKMANYWMHNGFLQVEGEKMAKSAGNFVTIRELLRNWQGHPWPGEALRFNMLRTQYRQPIDWTQSGLDESHKILWEWSDKTDAVNATRVVPRPVIEALCDDLNTPAAISVLHKLFRDHQYAELRGALNFLGFSGSRAALSRHYVLEAETGQLSLKGQPAVLIIKRADGTAELDSESKRKIEQLVADRTEARKSKNYKESDRIRDELAAMGVVLKDSKDGTTWEIAR